MFLITLYNQKYIRMSEKSLKYVLVVTKFHSNDQGWFYYEK